MEWGLHEDEAVWNGYCVRTRLCGMRAASHCLQNVYMEKGHVIVEVRKLKCWNDIGGDGAS